MTYILTALCAAIIGLAALVALQTYRLDQCQLKAKQLETCQEVRELEGEARDATDDDLIDAISQP